MPGLWFLLWLVGQQRLVLDQNVDDEDERAERDEQVRHVERGEPRDADHIDHEAGGDPVDEVCVGTGGLGFL